MTELNETFAPEETKERRAFAASEMVACAACSRTNPPTRANCLYCGGALEATDRNNLAHASSAVFEASTDNALNVVALPSNPGEAELEKAATLLNLTALELKAILSASNGGPISRVSDSAQAEMIRNSLRDWGIGTFTISDEQLDPGNDSWELRTLEFKDESLTGVHRRGAERISARWDEVVLVVAGRLHTTTIEVEQKRKRRSSQILNERVLSADESVLDIYVRGSKAPWRVSSANFDFSCLADKKAITTFENFRTLTDLLRKLAPQAHFDDSYLRLRCPLAKIWPLEEIEGKTERRRTATRDFEAKVTSSDNEAQFSRYSRLLSIIKTAERGEDHET